eukprot:15459002-Alexandrium_andersonii.AAC.1
MVPAQHSTAHALLHWSGRTPAGVERHGILLRDPIETPNKQKMRSGSNSKTKRSLNVRRVRTSWPRSCLRLKQLAMHIPEPEPARTIDGNRE